jgi:hypothetical protein
MSLQLSSETAQTAPNGAPRTRRTVGVGEAIFLTSNHPVQWIVDGTATVGAPTAHTNAAFLTAGTKIVQARTARGEQASLHFNVVLPSVAAQKVRDVPPVPNEIGAMMELQFILTPLEVSFAGLEFRELDCPATGQWGYYASGGAPSHIATPGWTDVDIRNRLVVRDTAGITLQPSQMRWPLSQGGFEWRILDEIRSGTQIHRLAAPMVQAARIDPVPGCARPPFRGTITIWKGGQTTSRRFS